MSKTPAPIPLSTAIRIGAGLRAFYSGQYFAPDGSCSCGLGAAYEAVTGTTTTNKTTITKTLTRLYDKDVKLHQCPMCERQNKLHILELVSHLTDFHRLSRLVSADVVEKLGY